MIAPALERPAMAVVARHERVRPFAVAVARLLWLALLLLGATAFIAGISPMLQVAGTPCDGSGCLNWQVRADSFHAFGPSPRTWAVFYVLLEATFLLIWSGAGTLLMIRAGRERTAIATAIMLVTFGTATFSDTVDTLQLTDHRWHWPVTLLAMVGGFSLLAVFFIFPDGRFAPAWTKPAMLIWAAVCLVGYLSPRHSAINQSHRLFMLVVLGFAVVVVAGQIQRYRRFATPEQREQIRIVITGVGIAIGFLIFAMFVIGGLGRALLPEYVLPRMINIGLAYAVLCAIPGSLVYAILRRRLWRAETVANRVIVYAIVTVLVIAVYVAVVQGLGALIPGNDAWLSLLATGIVAVGIQPTREAVQRMVDRRFFGQRAEPYAVVSHLGEQLAGVSAQEAELRAICETVAQTLRLPYVEIGLDRLDGTRLTAAAGAARELGGEWPLAHRGEIIGRLAVAPRAPDEPLAAADRRLLSDIARLVGTTLSAVRATEELQAAHARLLSAREEERRRLRRDLHDGLAPNLASQSMTLDAARKLMPTSPVTADRLFDDLGLHMQASMDEVRRIIYGLRPSALDELGFSGALTACARPARPGVMPVAVELTGLPEMIPAAVELAAYWIVREAITNADRHAGATACAVQVAADGDWLRVTIDDDGRGIDTASRPGIGLISMRERAVELGGTCAVESRVGGGTRVAVALPLTGGEP